MVWTAVFIGLFSVVMLALNAFFRRRRSCALPSVSDEEFLQRFARQFPESTVTKERILGYRQNFARELGLASEKLSPEQTFDELCEQFEILVDFPMAVDDLREDVLELARDRGLAMAENRVHSIGGCIDLLVEATELKE